MSPQIIVAFATAQITRMPLMEHKMRVGGHSDKLSQTFRTSVFEAYMCGYEKIDCAVYIEYWAIRCYASPVGLWCSGYSCPTIFNRMLCSTSYNHLLKTSEKGILAEEMTGPIHKANRFVCVHEKMTLNMKC